MSVKVSEAHPIRGGVRLRIPEGTTIYHAGQEGERMSDLPAWESVKECPKCGEEREQDQRQAAPPQSPHGWWTETVSVVSNGFKYEYIPAGDYDVEEHMEVICPRCGHGWEEQTKDAANE